MHHEASTDVVWTCILAGWATDVVSHAHNVERWRCGIYVKTETATDVVDHEAVADGVCLQKFANMMRVVYWDRRCTSVEI